MCVVGCDGVEGFTFHVLSKLYFPIFSVDTGIKIKKYFLTYSNIQPNMEIIYIIKSSLYINNFIRKINMEEVIWHYYPLIVIT